MVGFIEFISPFLVARNEHQEYNKLKFEHLPIHQVKTQKAFQIITSGLGISGEMWWTPG